MAINHLLSGMILQVTYPPPFEGLFFVNFPSSPDMYPCPGGATHYLRNCFLTSQFFFSGCWTHQHYPIGSICGLYLPTVPSLDLFNDKSGDKKKTNTDPAVDGRSHVPVDR